MGETAQKHCGDFRRRPTHLHHHAKTDCGVNPTQRKLKLEMLQHCFAQHCYQSLPLDMVLTLLTSSQGRAGIICILGLAGLLNNASGTRAGLRNRLWAHSFRNPCLRGPDTGPKVLGPSAGAVWDRFLLPVQIKLPASIGRTAGSGSPGMCTAP